MRDILKFSLVIDIEPGQGFWLAKCAEFNIEAQGNSPEDAKKNLETYLIKSSERPRNVITKSPDGTFKKAEVAMPSEPPVEVIQGGEPVRVGDAGTPPINGVPLKSVRNKRKV